jgi:hypothetical protein
MLLHLWGKSTPSLPHTQANGNASSNVSLRIAIINREEGSGRSINETEALIDGLTGGYPNLEAAVFIPRTNGTLSSHLRAFGEADVVIAIHGVAMFAVPVMHPGSLLIEVFPEDGSGPCLIYFYELASNCGITHKAYNTGLGHRHSFGSGGGNRCKAINSTATTMNAGVVLQMIQEWKDELNHPTHHNESSLVGNFDALDLNRRQSSAGLVCMADQTPKMKKKKPVIRPLNSKFEYEVPGHCPMRR